MMMKRVLFGLFAAVMVIVCACDANEVSPNGGDGNLPGTETAAGTVAVATPFASLSEGAVPAGAPLTLQTTTAGALIYYTTDGTTPSSLSTLYTVRLIIDAEKTVKAVAKKHGMKDSGILTAEYTIGDKMASPPEASPETDTYETALYVALAAADGRIYYTTDGSVPSAANGTPYTALIDIATTTTLKAVAVKAGFNDSPILTEVYIIADTAAAPVASPASGTYDTAQAVTLTTATTGASIYYTTDGTDPLSTSPLYTAPVAIAENATLKAVTVKKGLKDSAVTKEAYTINAAEAAPPVALPDAGTYSAAQAVTLTTATAGGSIYYTTDGTPPSATNGTLYTAPVDIATTTTLKAVTVKAGLKDSAVTEKAYTINAAEAAPAAPGTPVSDLAAAGKSIKLKFEGSKDKTGKDGVKAAFEELSAFIKTGGLDNAATNVIKLGDYIDLEGGLEIAGAGGSTFSSGSVDWNSDITGGHGKLSRLIVVGINSFNAKNGNSTPHVVFQFQNITHNHQMNATGGSNGGYPASDMRKYLSGPFLAGLIDAGVPDQVLWPPARMVQILNDATDEDLPLAQIEDTLWLPTAWEMTGSATANVPEETVGNQARLEYYASPASRVKYDASGAKQYWLASTCSNNDTVFASTKTDGNVQAGMGDYGAETPYGVAPAFCVQ
jgi:hypothetical protein